MLAARRYFLQEWMKTKVVMGSLPMCEAPSAMASSTFDFVGDSGDEEKYSTNVRRQQQQKRRRREAQTGHAACARRLHHQHQYRQFQYQEEEEEGRCDEDRKKRQVKGKKHRERHGHREREEEQELEREKEVERQERQRPRNVCVADNKSSSKVKTLDPANIMCRQLHSFFFIDKGCLLASVSPIECENQYDSDVKTVLEAVRTSLAECDVASELYHVFLSTVALFLPEFDGDLLSATRFSLVLFCTPGAAGVLYMSSAKAAKRAAQMLLIKPETMV